MNTLQAIAQRRSIRKFTQQKISQQQIETLLKAAMLAPTARNCQEWEFVVVREEKILQSLMQAHPHAQMLATASCAIVVCGNTKREYAKTLLSQLEHEHRGTKQRMFTAMRSSLPDWEILNKEPNRRKKHEN